MTCPRCGEVGELVTAEGDVIVYACPAGHPDWSVPVRHVPRGLTPQEYADMDAADEDD